MADSQTTKQWLCDIRAKSRRKKSILYEIDSIKQERETIYDTSHVLFGDDAKTATKKSDISDPTMRKALKLCGNLTERMNKLLFEYEKLDFEIDAARIRINKCFEEGKINLQEYEVLFYYYFDGLSNEEVAEKMSYSVQSVFRMKKDATNNI